MEMRIWLNLRLAMSLLTLASLLRRYRKVAQVRGADGPSRSHKGQGAAFWQIRAPGSYEKRRDLTCFGAVRQ